MQLDFLGFCLKKMEVVKNLFSFSNCALACAVNVAFNTCRLVLCFHIFPIDKQFSTLFGEHYMEVLKLSRIFVELYLCLDEVEVELNFSESVYNNKNTEIMFLVLYQEKKAITISGMKGNTNFVYGNEEIRVFI